MLYKNDDKQHIKLTYITHFYCNQNNMDSVFSLLRKYENLPLSIRSAVEFVIVDDGSPITYDTGEFALNITWLKIEEDIRWNQGGARNLGVVYAKSDKIFLTDLDIEISADVFNYLIKVKNPGRNFYKLYRNHPQKGIWRSHPNVFFMSRARFFRHFGYEEQYAGNYGYEDLHIVKYQKWHGSRQKHLPRHINITARELNRDTSYHSLVRDDSFNENIYKEKRKECSLYGDEYGYSRVFLNFTWKIIYRNSVFPSDLPVQKKWWRLIWWLRYLLPCLSR